MDVTPVLSLPPANSSRVSYFFFMLWNWASHRRSPVTERHDSFLERFRDPDLKEITNRENNTQAAGHSNAVRERKWVNGLQVTSGFIHLKLFPQIWPQTNGWRPWSSLFAERLGLDNMIVEGWGALLPRSLSKGTLSFVSLTSCHSKWPLATYNMNNCNNTDK